MENKCVIYFYLLANMLDIKKKIRYRSNEVRKTQNEHLIVFSKFVTLLLNEGMEREKTSSQNSQGIALDF